VFVIVTEPLVLSPIFIADALRTAPDPERDIVSEPLANALFEIVVGVAVKFAYVPPTATTANAPSAAVVRRTLFVLSAFHWSI